MLFRSGGWGGGVEAGVEVWVAGKLGLEAGRVKAMRLDLLLL